MDDGAIRLATTDDAGALAALWFTAMSARRAALDPAPPVCAHAEGLAQELSEVTERLAGDATVGVVADDDSGPVTMAIALPARTDDGAGSQHILGLAHVSMVAVRPDRWGEGLGAAVLRHVEDELAARSFTDAQLWTHESSTRARRLYERLGWRRSGRTRTDEGGEPICHYRRPLA